MLTEGKGGEMEQGLTLLQGWLWNIGKAFHTVHKRESETAWLVFRHTSEVDKTK